MYCVRKWRIEFNHPTRSALYTPSSGRYFTDAGDIFLIHRTTCTPTHGHLEPPKKKPNITRSFNRKWLTEYQWLRFDEQKNVMPCLVVFAEETTNFQRSAINRHVYTTSEHRVAVSANKQRLGLQQAIDNVKKWSTSHLKWTTWQRY